MLQSIGKKILYELEMESLSFSHPLIYWEEVQPTCYLSFFKAVFRRKSTSLRLNLHNPSCFPEWVYTYWRHKLQVSFLITQIGTIHNFHYKSLCKSNTKFQTITIIAISFSCDMNCFAIICFGNSIQGSLGHRNFRFIIWLDGCIGALSVEWYMLQFTAQSSWGCHQKNKKDQSLQIYLFLSPITHLLEIYFAILSMWRVHIYRALVSAMIAFPGRRATEAYKVEKIFLFLDKSVQSLTTKILTPFLN